MATTTHPSHKPQEDHNPGQEEFDKIIDKNFSQGDEVAMEERAKEGAEEDAEKKGSAEESQGSAEQSVDSSSESEQEQIEKHEETLGGGYKANANNKDKKKNYWQNITRRKGTMAAAGVFGGGLIVVFVLLFSFLNVFKLDDMISNIDAKTFSRFNAAADRRSDKWIQSYLLLRLMRIEGNGADPESEYFRANQVDRNNPIRDWYHTLRTSDFEKDLAEKGIVFANKDAGNYKFVVLEVDGNKIAGLTANDVRNGNLVDKLRTDPDFVQAKLAEVDLTKPGASKAARREIKTVVNENTRFWQVIQKRQIRKSIQNMTGVRDWRFFETTRDRVDVKKINIRNKILVKAIPEGTMSGKFVRCLFGISDCRFSEDPSDPQYRSEAALTDANKPDNENQPDTDPNGKEIGKVEIGLAGDVIKQIVGRLNVILNVVNIVATLDALDRVDNAISHHQISKTVAVARGVQAMGLYQVFKTSRDQMKTGQLSSEEVNSFMQTVGPISHGEGWTKVVEGGGDASKLTNTAASRKYCSAENQAKIENNPALGNKQFAYLCPSKQIGGTSTANTLEDAYNKTFGNTLGPVLDAYHGVRHLPGFKQLGDLLNKIIDTVFSAMTSVMQAVFKAAGIQDNIQDAMKWFIGQVTSFLGAGPIINGDEAAPVFMNWLVQGGSYTAEASYRANGAAKTTSATKVVAINNVNSYHAEKQAQMSVFDRYLSTSNPDSIVSRQAFALSEQGMSSFVSKFTDFGSIFRTIATGLTQPFVKQTSAAKTNGYTGADFAGIQTFDLPAACLNRIPLNSTPQNSTNIQEVLGTNFVADNELTWELVTNNLEWYDFVYGKIADKYSRDYAETDTVAEKIYNCNLLDTSVRGGIGNLYGYTSDNGLEDNQPGGDTSTSVPSGGAACSVVYGSEKGSGNEYTQEQLAKLFGNPGTASSHPEMESNLTTVDFLGHSVQVNKKAASCLSAVAAEIKQKNIKYDIKEMGCYRYDSDNGSSNIGLKSYHTYGVACDINWSSNPFVAGGASAPHDMPKGYIDAFHNHGWTWGGNWVSVKDYMHFEYNGINP